MPSPKNKVIVADNNFLTCKGLVALVNEAKGFSVVAEAADHIELQLKIKKNTPDIVILDFSANAFKLETVFFLNQNYPQVRLLAVTPEISSAQMAKALSNGLTSYVLKDCDKEEITEALNKTLKGERFLCGKIVDRLLSANQAQEQLTPSMAMCDGLNITDREMEIIKLIAEGYSNKEIAEKLFLSPHTVTTHRKNIMAKLGVNNTAGVVLFAVRENLLTPNKFLFS